jgi:Fe2+ transport system protein FeoA
MTIRLSDCKPGQSGIIQKIHGQGPNIQRLLELGFIEGKRVSLIRFAPFGDPMNIEFEGMRLALRRSEAEHLEIGL